MILLDIVPWILRVSFSYSSHLAFTLYEVVITTSFSEELLSSEFVFVYFDREKTFRRNNLEQSIIKFTKIVHMHSFFVVRDDSRKLNQTF